MRRAIRKRRSRNRVESSEALETRVLPATITVTSLADNTNASDGLTTLREAIEQANSTTDATTIQFGLSGVINLNSPLEIGGGDPRDRATSDDGNLTIIGRGQSETIIDGNGSEFIIRDNSWQDSTVLESLTLRNAETAISATGGELGGGTLTLEDALITGTTGSNALVFAGRSYSDNTFYSGSNGVTIRDSTIEDNSGRGVLLALRLEASIENTVVRDNGGSGVYSGQTGGYGDYYAPTTTIQGSTITGNRGFGTLNRNPNTSETFAEGGGIFHSAGTLTVEDSTIADNEATSGGGIYSQERTNIFTEDYLQVRRSTISGNTATQDGGGIFNRTRALIENSTISGNVADGEGGGILLEDVREVADLELTSLNVTNSTITQNSASRGGGIYTRAGDRDFPANDSVPTTFASTIVAENTAGTGPDFGFETVSDSSDVVLTDNFIGTNVGTQFSATGIGSPDGNGNFIGSSSSPIAPGIGSLTSVNGSLVHLPSATSPVVNQGSNPNNLSTDQAGRDRNENGGVDIGAVEAGASSGRITLNNGRLVVNGTSADNVVSIEKVGSNIEVTLDGELVIFPSSEIQSGYVKGRGGDDLIEVRFVTQPMELDGNGGNDTIKGGLGPDTILGGSGNDNLRGTQGADFLNGGGGNDLIRGQKGTDTLLGSNGKDTLQGNESNDVLFGGGGNDTLDGNDGRDILHGDAGNDRLEGGAE